MNKIIFKIACLVFCSVIAISAQQAEQNLPGSIPQPEPQPQLQVQQPLPPPAQQPLPPPQVQSPPQQIQPQAQQPQLQEQMRVVQQNDCPKPLAQTSIGLQARFNLNSVSYGFNSKKNKNIDMGIGFGGSIIRRTPINNYLDVNPEIGFFHRNLYSEKVKVGGDDVWSDETEFVLSIIPVLAQVTPFEVPFYVAIGFQLDFPMLAKRTVTINDKEETETFSDRAGYDLGVVWGLGYNITERFSFNFRSVVGLRSVTGTRSDTRTPTQYGIGVAFF